MTKTKQVKSVEEELRSLHGRFMSGEDLWRELGFRNSASFRKAKGFVTLIELVAISFRLTS